MKATWATAVLAAVFTIYEGPKSTDGRVEAATDRGPIIEMIVRCQRGTAIITYSKMERLFCDPRLVCDASRDNTIRRACG